jgi:hypothetical protein
MEVMDMVFVSRRMRAHCLMNGLKRTSGPEPASGQKTAKPPAIQRIGKTGGL